MKVFIIAILFATSTHLLAHEVSPGASKLTFCMDISETAGIAFEMKKNKKKIIYPKVDDLVVASFVKKAMDQGYKSKSFESAVREGFESCASSKLWSEISMQGD